MDAIKPNSMLRFNENQLQNVRKAVGYEDVNRLNRLIKKQNHFRVKEFDKEYLERLLISHKGSIERTKEKFDKLCTCLNLMPELLRNFDIKNEFSPFFNIADSFLLPTPTVDNYRVACIVVNGTDDEDYQVIQFFRHLIVLGHYMLTYDYCQGFEFVSDVSKLTFDVAKKFSPMTLHKAMMLLTECMGQRMKKLHFVNGSAFFEILLTLVKQGLTAKLRGRVLVHSNLESLYEHVPRTILPKELGGDELSTKELAKLTFKEISSEEHIKKIKFMEQASTDESLRLSCNFNQEYSGLPGSFKSLCVD